MRPSKRVIKKDGFLTGREVDGNFCFLIILFFLATIILYLSSHHNEEKIIPQPLLWEIDLNSWNFGIITVVENCIYRLTMSNPIRLE